MDDDSLEVQQIEVDEFTPHFVCPWANVAALHAGIATLMFVFNGIIGALPFAVLAILNGGFAIYRIRQSDGELGGKRRTIVSLIVGGIVVMGFALIRIMPQQPPGTWLHTLGTFISFGLP